VLTRGHTLRPTVLLLGGPNCYIKGMRDCWRYNIPLVWKERGVVMEEWRLGRGAGQRMFDQQLPVLFRGSRYAERLPIGTPECIRSCSAAAIRRFYRDWYRPDLLAVVAVFTWLYFRFSVLASHPDAARIATFALLLTLVVSFLFAAVSAWAIAMISVTPISGMTLTTLILSAIILAKLGLTGPDGMLATLLIGGVVCTALSMTGSLVTEFKISYWLGATPRRVQWSNILAAAVASITVTAAIMLFATTKGYLPSAAHPNPMPAPQANAMAAVIQSVMASAEAPWLLYGVDAVIALIVEMLGVSALAFALGMYLPIELNTPILFGALVAEYVRRRAPSEDARRARNNRGTLIASGLIAGGALAGVADGILSWIADARGATIPALGNLASFGNWLGLVMFCALAGYVIWDANRAREEEGAGPAISI
jgi:hypothetical protein